MNKLATEASSVSNAYSWNFLLNIKTAGKINRLSSLNHKIRYETTQEGTFAQVTLHNGEQTKMGKDFVINFSHDKMFEPIGFTQTNEFGEQTFLVNYLPIIKP